MVHKFYSKAYDFSPKHSSTSAFLYSFSDSASHCGDSRNERKSTVAWHPVQMLIKDYFSVFQSDFKGIWFTQVLHLAARNELLMIHEIEDSLFLISLAHCSSRRAESESPNAPFTTARNW